RKYAQCAAKMFLALHWHVRSVEQTILRAGEKMPKYTMPWIYRKRTSTTKSSLSRSLDHLEDPRSKKFGGSLQSSSLLHLSRSISMLLSECGTQGRAIRCSRALLRSPTAQISARRQSDIRIRSAVLGIYGRLLRKPGE